MRFDCDDHGMQYGRDWCPFCRIEALEKEKVEWKEKEAEMYRNINRLIKERDGE